MSSGISSISNSAPVIGGARFGPAEPIQKPGYQSHLPGQSSGFVGAKKPGNFWGNANSRFGANKPAKPTPKPWGQRTTEKPAWKQQPKTTKKPAWQQVKYLYSTRNQKKIKEFQKSKKIFCKISRFVN